MRNRYAFLIAVILLTPQLTEAAILRRFVLVAGANNGGTERETLRYAISDAENFANVLEAMGGVATEDVFVLREPSSAGFSKALDELRQRVSQTPVEGIRPEVVVYYSGHADDRGLLLGGDRLSYQSLRAQIDDVPADVAGIFFAPSPYHPAAIISPQPKSILSSVPPCLVRRVDQAEGGCH